MIERTPENPQFADMLKPRLMQTLNQYRANILFKEWGESLLKEGNLEDFSKAPVEEETL